MSRRVAIVLLSSSLLVGAAASQPVAPRIQQRDLVANFDDLEPGVIGSVWTAPGEFSLAESDPGSRSGTKTYLEIGVPDRDDESEHALLVPGGVSRRMQLHLPQMQRGGGPLEGYGSVSFRACRAGKRQPFALSAVFLGDDGELEEVSLDDRVNAGGFREVVLPLPAGTRRMWLEHTSPDDLGLWVDDVTVHSHRDMQVVSAEFVPTLRPLVEGVPSEIGRLVVSTVGDEKPRELTAAGVNVVERTGAVELIELETELRSFGAYGSAEVDDGAALTLTHGQHELRTGLNEVVLFATVHAGDDGDPLRHGSLRFEGRLEIGGEDVPVTTRGEIGAARLAAPVFEADPARVETTALVVVPGDDARLLAVLGVHDRDGSSSLVLLTSDDMGRTWERDEIDSERSLSRPTIVTDRSGALHLIACESKTGTPDFTFDAVPEEAARVVHLVSRDGGETWSDPVDVTASVRREGVMLLRPAGGRGVMTSSGALVIPMVEHLAQPPITEPSGVLMISEDGGETWRASPRAFLNTGRGALCELGDGALLLNLVDLRGARRRDRLTRDFGETWQRRAIGRRNPLECVGEHAALIHVGREQSGSMDGRLVLLNPSVSRKPVREMAIRGSNDNGDRWPAEQRVVLDGGVGVGAPGLALVERETLVAVYASSSGTVVAQVVPLGDVVGRLGTVQDVTGGR